MSRFVAPQRGGVPSWTMQTPWTTLFGNCPLHYRRQDESDHPVAGRA
jgi:predicted secreted protein